MKFTDDAINKFKEMMQKEEKDSIRIFLFQSCCSSAVMIDAEKGKPGDKLAKEGDVLIYIEPDAHNLLSDAEIDCENGELKIKGMRSEGSSCCG